MHTRKCLYPRILAGVAAGTLVFITAAANPARAETEEQRLVRIAQILKPISDVQWNEIAGPRMADAYDIQSNDTLWGISKRLFGNPFYWPKIWTFNGDIRNPHVISPGQKLAFTPGTSEGVPRLTTGDAIPAGDAPKVGFIEGGDPSIVATTPPLTNHEYDKIPADWWMPTGLQHTKKYDETGMDRELKVKITSRFNFPILAFANEKAIAPMGEITGSRREGKGLSTNETVFVKSENQELQVGQTYAILDTPEHVREAKSDRDGYLYRASGEVKIIGIKDELYVGIIQRAYDAVIRGDKLYPSLPRISDIKPVPASTSIEAMVMLDKKANAYSSQFQFIHLDRGIEDGVEVGHVFRLYDYSDPYTKKKITDSDFLIRADAIVVHTTAQFSTALVIRSLDIVQSGDFAVSLMDVSDLERQVRDRMHDLGVKTGAQEGDAELDELDMLDRTTGEGLGKKEEQEIKELDQWDKTRGQAPEAELAPPAEDTTIPEVVPMEPSEPEAPAVEPLAPEVPGDLPPPDETLAQPDEPAPSDAPPSDEPAPDASDDGEALPPLDAPAEAPPAPDGAPANDPLLAPRG